MCLFQSTIPPTAAPCVQWIIYNDYNSRSTSSIIPVEEGDPVSYSQVHLSQLVISLGVAFFFLPCHYFCLSEQSGSRQNENLYALAYSLGYVPKVTTVASVPIDYYQQVPSILSASVYIPDYNYALLVPENTQITSVNDNTIKF